MIRSAINWSSDMAKIKKKINLCYCHYEEPVHFHTHSAAFMICLQTTIATRWQYWAPLHCEQSHTIQTRGIEQFHTKKVCIHQMGRIDTHMQTHSNTFEHNLHINKIDKLSAHIVSHSKVHIAWKSVFFSNEKNNKHFLFSFCFSFILCALLRVKILLGLFFCASFSLLLIIYITSNGQIFKIDTALILLFLLLFALLALT